MNRIKWTGLLVILLICGLLVSPIQATGGAQAPLAKGTVVPLRADQQITRTVTTPAGKPQTQRETSRLYRDSQGRTRVEAGAVVTIKDPTTQTTLILNTKEHTFRRLVQEQRPKQREDRPAGAMVNQKISSAPRALGTKQIEGVRAEGRSYTVTVPKLKAQGTQPPAKEVTLWLSTDVQLPVLVQFAEANRAYEQRYTNVQARIEPDAGLFKLPAGYREVSPNQMSAQADESCPVQYNDPVILNSFEGWYYAYYDGAWVYASTNADIGCIFVFDYGAGEYPLWGYPAAPLYLPVDLWGVYDLGWSVPYYPYVAFGDIVFIAANGSDTTTVDSLIVLTRWPI